METKKVLVCGAGGFIGAHLVKDLKEKDFPLMFSVLKSICENKKLEINW